MPQYYRPPENWNQRGKITIIFKPYWRNIPILRGYPFWVGDQVTFHIHTENPGGGNPYAFHSVQQLMDNVIVGQFNIENIDEEIVTTPISSEGNLRMSLGVTNFSQPQDPLIITANIQNKDRWWIGFAGLLIGAILGFCGELIFAFTQIDKAWHIWFP